MLLQMQFKKKQKRKANLVVIGMTKDLESRKLKTRILLRYHVFRIDI